MILMWRQCGRLSPDAKISLEWREFGKIASASIFMGIIVVYAKQIIPVNGLLRLVVLVFVGVIAYGIMTLILRVEILKAILRKIRRPGD